MAIQVEKEPPKKFRTTCGRCQCVFTYELSDLRRNYVFGREEVYCPRCGESCRHKELW